METSYTRHIEMNATPATEKKTQRNKQDVEHEPKREQKQLFAASVFAAIDTQDQETFVTEVRKKFPLAGVRFEDSFVHIDFIDRETETKMQS